MSTKVKPNNTSKIFQRVGQLEQEVRDLHQRCAILSLIADILAERGIVTEMDIENHVRTITERLQLKTRGEISNKTEEVSGTEGMVGP